MSWPVGLAGGGAFVAALAIGIAFGFVLERAGLGQPKQLLGLFYLEDRFRPLAELRARVRQPRGDAGRACRHVLPDAPSRLAQLLRPPPARLSTRRGVRPLVGPAG